MANEAGFNRQRSLLRWASKLYSFLTHISREFVINKKVLQVLYLQDSYVAGVGPEPTTSGLWIRRSNQLSYPAIVVCGCKGTLNFWIFQIKTKLFFCNWKNEDNYYKLWKNLCFFIPAPAEYYCSADDMHIVLSHKNKVEVSSLIEHAEMTIYHFTW